MRRFSLLMILLLVLSGCVDSGEYKFSDTSDNWKVIYVVDVSNDNEQETTGTLEYVGDEPIPETIDYEIATRLTTLGGTGKTLNDGKANIGNDQCKECAVIQADEEIEVEITWDGQTEKLILTNTK